MEPKEQETLQEAGGKEWEKVQSELGKRYRVILPAGGKITQRSGGIRKGKVNVRTTELKPLRDRGVAICRYSSKQREIQLLNT